MKRFIFSILCASVFFIGLGSLVNQAGARLKSDERALTLIRQARIAIGGETNINNVRSLTVKGHAARTFDFDGTDKTQTGDLEINLALPNQFAKMIRLGTEDKTADGAKQTIGDERRIVVIKRDDGNAVFKSEDNDAVSKNRVVVIKKGDKANSESAGLPNGDIVTSDGGNVRREIRVERSADASHRNNEFLRTMLALFLTAPEGTDVSYFYAGADDVDGTPCEIVEAKTESDSVAKIYLSKSTNLPVMLSYQGMDLPKIVKINHDDLKPTTDNKAAKVIVRESGAPALVEINLKFSDYRTVGNLQLPYQWTQIANGKTAETVNIDSYEINPANIADKFNQMQPRVLMRTEKQQ